MDSIYVIQTGLTGVFILFQNVINSFQTEWGLVVFRCTYDINI